MEFGLWEKYYNEILDDFNFSRENDEKSAKLLDEILSTEGCLRLDELQEIIGFSDKFIVFGAGPSLNEHIELLKNDRYLGRGGHFCFFPTVYPIPKQVKSKLSTAINPENLTESESLAKANH